MKRIVTSLLIFLSLIGAALAQTPSNVRICSGTPPTCTPVSASNPLPVGSSPSPATSGGLSVYFLQPTASTNANNIKASAGQVYKIDIFNNSATVHYLRLYNTATTGTCNSATGLVGQWIIPGSTTGAGVSSSWDLGIAFSAGIALCVTSGYDGTGNATASALMVNIGYK